MPRAFILLLDSFGIGAAPDAKHFGDEQANTFGHIAEVCYAERIRQGMAAPGLHIPYLMHLGLGKAAEAASGTAPAGIPAATAITGAYGYAREQSAGKDTPSGHWEIAGVPVMQEWGYFPPAYPSFPAPLIEALTAQGQLPGILGNCHASGTTIIEQWGEEHIQTGKPIVYTSADSVLQIAAHEETFGLQRLYDLCAIARILVDDYRVGRVIARPFLGQPGNFYRTGNRKDLTTPPPAPTLLDKLITAGREVIAIGKVADIFAHRGISQLRKANGNAALWQSVLEVTPHAPDGSLTFVNFVDFDMLYGHRRDVAGYGAALEAFDRQLPAFQTLLQPDDLAIITADHGCDPTLPGSDHTREYIPVLAFGPSVVSQAIGERETFADIGQTIAHHLGIAPLETGTAFSLSAF